MHLKELLASIKVKLDPCFCLPWSEIAVKFRGQRDCHVPVRERFTHKSLVEKNLEGKKWIKKNPTTMSHKHGSVPVGVEQSQVFSLVI